MGYLLYSICIFPIAEIIEIFFTILYRVTNSYGAATVGLSFVVTLLTLPIYMVAEHWQDVERKKEMAMAPKVARIKKGFRGDERFMILSAYYREQHYKPYYALRSAFSILIQIPFFMAAYSLLSQMQALRGCSFWFLEDLGKPDGMIRVGGVTLNLLPIAMTLFNCVAGYIYSKGHPLKEKIQIYGMAALFFLILYQSPSGLLLYWTMNNALSLLKNIFYRLKHPLKVLLGLMYLALLSICIALTRRGTGRGSTLLIVYGIALFLSLLPLWLFLLKRYHAKWLSPLDAHKKERRHLFLASMGGYFFLLGWVIPLNLLSSSPTEFSFLEPYSHPLVFALFSLMGALGFFLWAVALYHMFPSRIQSFFALASSLLFAMALVDTFLFQGSYGSMLVGLQFSNASMGGHLGRQIANLLSLLLLFAFIAFFIGKNVRILFRAEILILFALLLLSSLRLFAIISSYKGYLPQHQKAESEQESSQLEKVFTFTKTGKNVLLVMVDRGMSCYVPYIFSEKPELKEAYSGFTYYPNTISYGEDTLHASSALYGGYEYTPLAMQEREGEKMVDKHNEALKVLPKLFSENGFEVVVTNPPWSNYKWYFDGTPFSGMEHVTAMGITSRYAPWFKNSRFQGKTIQYSKLLACNMLRYAFFTASPLATHAILYDNGTWLNELNPALYTTGGLDDLFVRQYATMDALPFITEITDDATSRYNSFDTELAHEEVILHLPDYVPVEQPSESDKVAPVENVKQYHVNMAFFLLLSRWFDFLKEQGVYDNTRIIVVSDHGAQSKRSAQENLLLPGGNKHLDQYRALLMVKDFNQKGEMRIDDTFMTNADTPALLVEGIITDPVNPYTHAPLSNEGKENGVAITTSSKWKPEQNGKYAFDISPEQWLQVKDDIFSIGNWRQVTP